MVEHNLFYVSTIIVVKLMLFLLFFAYLAPHLMKNAYIKQFLPSFSKCSPNLLRCFGKISLNVT
jgi:hypothetical protein